MKDGDTIIISEEQLREACAAWGWTPDTGSGSMGLSSWMRRTLGSFTAAQYGQLVAQVRKRTGDTTDYSTYYEADAAPHRAP
jgi:hypothetical protein